MAVPTVWLEDVEGRQWQVASSCAIGRANTNTIVIDDGRVSRRHALIHKQDDSEYWIIDLGSGNGTYLNGRRVVQPTRLADGDTLTVHDRTFAFRRIAASDKLPDSFRVSEQTIINIRSIDCWLLVADIMGSTGLAARLEATEMAMLVGRWVAECKEIVESHNGAINKFLGDGFFAYWLAESVDGDRIAAAMQALRALQRDKAEPRFRLVLHYGMAAFGGGGSLGEDSLSGLDVTLAFRMEELAGRLGCDLMVSDEVRRQLGTTFPLRDLGEHPVQGFQRPKRFYAIR